MIVTVGATKGGVRKTMVTLNLALGRALVGRDVWLGSPQKTEFKAR
jgi:cellulose biosynthesis protein BcsQ